MKRLLLALAGLLAVMLTVTVGGSWLLSRWLPRYGQVKLEAAVEARWPVDLRVGRLDYHLMRGLTASDLTLTDAGGQVLFASPEVRLRPRWGSVLLGRIGFGGDADMEAPYRAPLILAGWVHAGGASWRLDAQTPDTPLAALAPVLAQRVPTPLIDGRFFLRVRLDQTGRGALRAGARLEGRRLRWRAEPLAAVADVTLEGDAAPDEAGVWRYDIAVLVREGRIEGVPVVGAIEQLEASGRLTPEGLRVERLVGTALDTTWHMTGEVQPLTPPAATFLIRGRPDAARVLALWPAGAGWSATGALEVNASCRSLLAPAFRVDCQAAAAMDGATLTTPWLASPLTNVTGRIEYDLIERRASIESLTAKLSGETLTARGQLALREPPELALSIDGAVNAQTVSGLLERFGIAEPSGALTVHLDVDGPATSPELRGQLDAQGVAARLGTNRIGSLTGSLMLQPERITAEALRFHWNDQPVTLAFTATTGAVPEIRATASLPGGAVLAGNAKLLADTVVIDAARLELAQSRLQLSGSVSRKAGSAAAVHVRGAVDLEELARLPWLPLPSLAAWQPRGLLTLDGVFEGRPADWRQASWRGQAQGEGLRLKDVPVDQLVCEFDNQSGALRLRVPSASVAGGAVQADLALEPRETGTGFLLKLDVTQLQLERLTDALPAWRGRDIQGAASAKAALSGVWEQRASWVGDGWLNASGDRLGELPLLEKVFKGFFGVLADRLGLDALRRGQITQAGFQWQLSQERLHTEDLRLSGTSGGEPVAVYARGSVGLDQSLDLVIEPELSEGMLLQAPSTASIANTVLKAANRLERFRRLVGRHRLTGTLAQPQYRFEYSLQEVFRQLVPAPEDLLQGLFNSLGGGQQ